MKHEKAWAYAAFATVCIVWGTTYLAIRIALETLPPLLLTGSRFVTSGLIMLAIAKFRGDALPKDGRTLLNLALVGFLMVGIGNLAVVWAEQWVPSGLAALFVATAPFWMAVIEAFRTGGERVDVRGGIGMLLGFGGVALLVTPGGSGAAWSIPFVIAALAVQLGSFCWQLGAARSKYVLQGVPIFASAGYQMFFGGVICTVVGFAIGEAPRFAFSTRSALALAYLTIFGGVIAYSAYTFANKHMRTTHSSLYAYVNPVVAVFLGWLILAEPLTPLSIVAMVVILAGVAMVQTGGRRKVATEVKPEVIPKAA